MSGILRPIVVRFGRRPPSFDPALHIDITGTGARASVTIDHQVPASEDARAGWRVTTSDQHLPTTHFHEGVRGTIACADHARGRRLFYVDLASQEVLVAVSYHVDGRRRVPLTLTALGLRADGDSGSDLYACSRGAARISLAYVAAIARRVGRPNCIDIDVDDDAAIDVLETLGFQPTTSLRGVQPLGTYLRQAGFS